MRRREEDIQMPFLRMKFTISVESIGPFKVDETVRVVAFENTIYFTTKNETLKNFVAFVFGLVDSKPTKQYIQKQ